MTLAQRATFLILPIVIAGYMTAALLVYWAQSGAMLSLERARLSQQLAHAESLFRGDVAQARGFLFSLLEGDSVRRFMQEGDETYRYNALSLRLQESIRSLSDDQAKFISFSIIGPDLATRYYFESSADPFAEMSGQQQGLARRLIAGTQLHDWTYLHEGMQRPIIVQSEFIDPVTFNRALSANKARAILVQVAIQPDQFIGMKSALQAEYEGDVTLTPVPPAPNDTRLAASVRLAPALYLTMAVPQAHVSSGLLHLKIVLSIGTLAISILTIVTMVTLIRRFICNPIAVLDRKVTAVMSGAATRIVPETTEGEIGRLSVNIETMHDQSMRALDLVRSASWTDPLTGLPNRARFQALSGEALEAAEREGQHVALLFLDIDNFKFVNDKHGHVVGDEVLRTLADRLRDRLGAIAEAHAMPIPALARLSGDEFAVLLTVPPGDRAVDAVSTAILSLFAGGFEIAGKAYPITASIGIALFPDDASDGVELVINADAAMYQAKTEGKNRASRFSRTLKDRRDRSRQIQDELMTMDPDEEFSLVYMPIVDRRGRVTGCEALLRWTSPALGQVGPDEFVPIAESSGLFSKIDWWVVRRAMSDYRRLEAMFGANTILAINVSSAELHSRAIGAHLSDQAAAHGLQPGVIEIELTETYAVEAGLVLREAVEALRARGFRLSIDDFGAGYTSVQQLIEYPADTLKLDRAMVETMATTDMLAALRAMIALCHARGMSVVAEGVETKEKMDLLIAAGCDLFQGYYISKPLSLDDLGLWALQRLASPAATKLKMPTLRSFAPPPAAKG
ncbi:putative bifunctional diguanylate cyclase/phosphodiesterase [Rhizobium sp. YIM 134829]|uniref:putative bifunctional diguanylate cyclase/phosphodiesterase n=1 Tax=Rhizobium sp. YIM 134829 TaxID=3390453 RepID=UPI00397982EB